MFRRTINKFLVAGLAAASLTTFAIPAQAATDEATASAQGWCEIVPAFCSKQCNNTARCNPCQPPSQTVRNRGEQAGCGVRNRE